MLVGIRIELLQPGFDLLHQLIFSVPQSYLKHHPSNPGLQLNPQSNGGNGSMLDRT
jgi:hypothetical protein